MSRVNEPLKPTDFRCWGAHEFYRRVCEAFQRRMEKILPPDRIREAMANPVFGRMVANKYREVAKDNNNERLSQKRVLAGHIASLMHSLVLAFG